ncbi:hypothetical protein T261_07327 [Streptomyces lydicus]|nr:hypothetical protein T261_07327 [Streptomyces lydicus]
MDNRNRALPLVGAATVTSPVLMWNTGAPWWVIVLLTVLAAACAALNSVFPQASRDRLEWWRDRRRHQRLRAVRRGQRAH